MSTTISAMEHDHRRPADHENRSPTSPIAAERQQQPRSISRSPEPGSSGEERLRSVESNGKALTRPPERHPSPRPPEQAQQPTLDEVLSRRNTLSFRQGEPGLDWIVPERKLPRASTVGERLQPTIDTAEKEKDKYARKARMTGLALNIAIGLQVLLGAFTTGLSAGLSGRSASVATTILGGLATLVASYLARTRGSNEPELSITRKKDLDQFLRECRAFQMDHGHEGSHSFDEQIQGFRNRFEELLGNADGQRRLATV